MVHVHRAFFLAIGIAVFAGVATFLWVQMAMSFARAPPAPMPVPATPFSKPTVIGPRVYVPWAAFDNREYWVLRDQQAWQKSAAAGVCSKAATLHQAVVLRYTQTPPAARDAAGDVLTALPMTLATVIWVQSTGSDATLTVAGSDASTVYALVDGSKDVPSQVLAVLQSLMTTPLQQTQLANLIGPSANLTGDGVQA